MTDFINRIDNKITGYIKALPGKGKPCKNSAASPKDVAEISGGSVLHSDGADEVRRDVAGVVKDHPESTTGNTAGALKETAPSKGRTAAPLNITDLHSERPQHIRSLCPPDLAPGNSYNFADDYTIHQLMTNPAKAKEFEARYLLQEHEYFKQARHPVSGLTYDGIQLDEKTGKPVTPRAWSAPSKECLDLAVCIKALGGNKKAAMVVAKGKKGKARKEAARIMEQKIDTYWDFYKKNPGYGGYLPWFLSDDRLTPSADWEGEAPGLDNGEFAWTVLVAEHELRKQGFTKTADKYKKYLNVMIDHATKMFYDEEAGLVRGDVRIVDPQSKESKYETIKNKPGRCDYLTGEHGAHEGMMMVAFVSLFGKGLPKSAVDRIWKKTRLKRVEHKAGSTWQAFWGSSHESWAYLFMPLRDMKPYKDLFRIREKIRTQNAAERGYPGLATSTNNPGEPGYLDGAGIEDIGSQPIRNNHTYAIYGAFPLLLEFSDKNKGNAGQAWLLNMLKAPKMQGPIGGGESGTNDGKKACCMKTIDGTFPNVIAAFGGLEKETAKALKHHGKYEDFIRIMMNEYKEAFGNEPLNEPVGFALPSRAVPQDLMADYRSLSNAE